RGALAGREATAASNATAPADPLTLGETLERVGAAVGFSGRLVWVDNSTLAGAGVQPWSELPLWLPGAQYAGLLRADVTRALAFGLTLRPLAETARDTLASGLDAREREPRYTREKEQEILSRL